MIAPKTTQVPVRPWAACVWADPLDAKLEAEITTVAREHKGSLRAWSEATTRRRTLIFSFDFYRDAIKFVRYIRRARYKVTVGAPWPEDGKAGVDVRRVMYRWRSVRC
jgi:hypothetical protein